MSEENTQNPMDLNGDGKVTLGEKIKYAAGKADEVIDKAMSQLKEDAAQTAAQAKVLYDKAEDKTKEFCDKAGDKTKEVYAQAKDKTKDLLEDAKEGAEKAADKAKSLFEKDKGEDKQEA